MISLLLKFVSSTKSVVLNSKTTLPSCPFKDKIIGKQMPKVQKLKSDGTTLRHDPLSLVITQPNGKLRTPKKSNQIDTVINDDFQDDYQVINDKISSDILRQEKMLRKDMDRDRKSIISYENNINSRKNSHGNKVYESSDEESEESDNNFETEDFNDNISDNGEEGLLQLDGEYVFNNSTENGLSESEELIVQKFLSTNKSDTRTLADIIFEKIKEKEEQNNQNSSNIVNESSIPPKVIEVYTSIGKFLQHYKSGKLPKALKILPNLKNWEEILYYTEPESWSCHAVYQCTKIFVSNMNEKLTQKYLNMVLLERCRDDLRRNYNKLNYFLYLSLKKSLFKPGAFYKGILLPLAMSNDCSLKEAMIFGSIMSKVSIPANHSAVVLLKLLELPYNGSNSVFIKILLNKKYALPTKVINSIVNHFYQFINETRVLPVLWHQSLLVFAQRYKLELSNQQKELLKELLKIQCHHLITPEIRRELFSNQTNHFIGNNNMIIS